MRQVEIFLLFVGLGLTGCNNNSSSALPNNCTNFPATCAPYQKAPSGSDVPAVTISSNDPACNAGLDSSTNSAGVTQVIPPENCGVLLTATSSSTAAPNPTQILLPSGQTPSEYDLTLVGTAFDTYAGIDEIEIDGVRAVCNLDGSAISTGLTNYPTANGNNPPALAIQDNSAMNLGGTVTITTSGVTTEYTTLPIASSTVGTLNVTLNMPALAQVNYQFFAKAKNEKLIPTQTATIGFWATNNNQIPGAFCSKAGSPFIGIKP
jgi:hypothetical protein